MGGRGRGPARKQGLCGASYWAWRLCSCLSAPALPSLLRMAAAQKSLAGMSLAAKKTFIESAIASATVVVFSKTCEWQCLQHCLLQQ